jgi:YbbR domain-containing protein
MKEKQSSKPNKKKIRTIAVSIFLAVIVWFMVVYVNDPDITTTLTDIKVTFIGEGDLRAKDLVVTGKDDIPQISIVVTGKRSDLMNFMDDISLQIDVSSITAEGEYNLQGKLYMPTTRITVEKEKYGEIPITVEAVEEKEVDVSLQQTGTLKDKIVKSDMIEPKVKISGAKSEIDAVAGATATIDISNITADSVEHVNYVLVDEYGELITKNETIESMHREIEVRNTLYNVKNLPVVAALSSDLSKDYMLKTDSVSITPSNINVGVDDTNTADKIVVTIDKLTDNETEYELTAGNGMYIPPLYKKVKVKADIVKKTASTVGVTVSAENVASGLKAETDGKINVHILSGRENISESDIKATVDVSGLGEGQYTLPVKLWGENIEFQGSYTIGVTIKGE